MSDTEPLANLTRKVEELTRQVGELRAVNEIRMLQHNYGYYPDEFVEGQAAIWPRAALQPFHYPHPVTGGKTGG